MAKQTGLGATVTVDDSGGTPRAISNDVTNFEVSTPMAVIETTGVDKSAMERLLGIADYSVTLEGVPNFSSAPSSHDTFKTVVSTRVNRTTAILMGSGGATLTAEVLYSGYTITRDDTAKLTWRAEGANGDGATPVWS